MAIKISLEKTDSRLFCCSKWWGDPDMPKDMSYPMYKTADSEEYPLTFVCQIDCSEIYALDPSCGLPPEGMLYFFAALDEYLGYETPFHLGLGSWPKGAVKVKYAKTVNPETFESYIMVDDEDEPLTLPPLKMQFSLCDEADDGIKLLGVPFSGDVRDNCPGLVNLLQIDSEADSLEEDIRFYDCGFFHFLLKPSELENQWWHSCGGYLTSL